MIFYFLRPSPTDDENFWCPKMVLGRREKVFGYRGCCCFNRCPNTGAQKIENHMKRDDPTTGRPGGRSDGREELGGDGDGDGGIRWRGSSGMVAETRGRRRGARGQRRELGDGGGTRRPCRVLGGDRRPRWTAPKGGLGRPCCELGGVGDALTNLARERYVCMILLP